MRGRLSAGVILAVGVTAGAARADVVVDYDRPPPTFGAPPKEVLRQHGQRIRIDGRSVMDRTGVVLLRQTYTRPGQPVQFALASYENGRWAHLSVMDDPLAAPPPAALRRFTGATETHLGERCRVWRVVRRPSPEQTFVQSGCVTPDGVELWRRQANIDAIFATRVARQPVPPAEVRVPTQALDLAAWAPAKDADHSGDYEVVLAPRDAGGPRLTIRRSGAWTAVSKARTDYTTLTITNPVAGLVFSYSRAPDGERHLSIRRQPPGAAPASADSSAVRIPTRPDETVLGERCSWWNTTPNIVDFEQDECRTADGIALKVSTESRGSQSTAVAAILVRGPQPLSAVMPGAEVASPAAWGF